MPDETYAFVDTNFFMHFPPIDSVDWCKHLDARPVTLVIDQQVLRELDKLKDGARGQGRRDKARTLTSKLHKLLDADEPQLVRDGVYIVAHLNAVAIDYAAERLDPTIQDDRIVAGMMTFRNDHPKGRIILVANDGGIRLKARMKKFESWNPEDALERRDIASDEERELLALRRQVAEHQARKPAFEFGIAGEEGIERLGSFVFEAFPKDELSEEMIMSKLDSERSSCLSGCVPIVL